MSTGMIGLPCTRRRIQNACRMPAHVTLQNALNIEQADMYMLSPGFTKVFNIWGWLFEYLLLWCQNTYAKI